ncbi:MAG TPA: 2'-5' RNA ligase family protein [Vicinamibacterales bacterium]|nr:2'-5' RNA ligase family protein [Vicinamibacterales bacterium]
MTALIVPIPEAESVVGPFREAHDPAYAEGVPAHVTVLYPFLSPSQITPAILEELDRLFAGCVSFRATFADFGRFPGVLYLAPSDAGPFVTLTTLVVSRFPDAPPYGGQFNDVVPHLTVAHAADSRMLDLIETDMRTRAGAALPIQATIREVILIEKQGVRWSRCFSFPLAAID